MILWQSQGMKVLLITSLTEVRGRTALVIDTNSSVLLFYNGSPLDWQLHGAAGGETQVCKNGASSDTDIWLGLVEDLYKLLGMHSQALSKHLSDAAKWHPEIQYVGLRNILTSAAFVYNLGIMCDAASELYDLSKQLKERHNIARSLFWGVKADSGFCINGWQSWLSCWRGCQCFSEHVLEKKTTNQHVSALGEMS